MYGGERSTPNYVSDIYSYIGLPGADAIMPNSIMHVYTGKGQQTASSHN